MLQVKRKINHLQSVYCGIVSVSCLIANSRSIIYHFIYFPECNSTFSNQNNTVQVNDVSLFWYFQILIKNFERVFSPSFIARLRDQSVLANRAFSFKCQTRLECRPSDGQVTNHSENVPNSRLGYVAIVYFFN